MILGGAAPDGLSDAEDERDARRAGEQAATSREGLAEAEDDVARAYASAMAAVSATAEPFTVVMMLRADTVPPSAGSGQHAPSADDLFRARAERELSRSGLNPSLLTPRVKARLEEEDGELGAGSSTSAVLNTQ